MMSGVTAIFFITETLWLRNIHIEKEQTNFGTYQNSLDMNKDSLIKEAFLKKKNLNLKNSTQLVKNKNLSSVTNNLLTIDYTFPIDYY